MKEGNEYYKIVKNRAEINMCDGDCHNRYGHSGGCKVYEVFDYADKSWGLFSYCDNAVKKDESNGFTLRPYDE